MPDNICQRFGGDSVRGYLHRGWQCRHRLGRLNNHFDRAKPPALLAQCPDQPEFVSSGRAEPVRELPYGFDGLSQLIRQLNRQ